MAIYLHIPFCKQACHYCDFHFSTSKKNSFEMVEAMCKEIELQKNYLDNQYLSSIYLGGGTPSLLTEKELNLIFNTIAKYYTFDKNTEITLEANPDDINIEQLLMWKNTSINRLSIGIQTFNDEVLKKINRAHQSTDAKKSIFDAQNKDFKNITIDLMYAMPSQTNAIFEEDLMTALSFDVPHISAYCLTIEEKTSFGKWVKNKKMMPISEEIAAEQYEILTKTLKNNDYEQYEISNFAKNKQYAKHNKNYWKQGKYLGIGASAHSYNGVSRQFNIANNALYIKKIQENKIPFTIENLSENDHINEYLLTGLRTIWGVDLSTIKTEKNINFLEKQHFIIEKYKENECLWIENNTIFLTEKGKIIADKITSDLFL